MAKREYRIKDEVRGERMFVTGSSRNDGTDTILTSSYNEMSNSFAQNRYLAPDGHNHSATMQAIIWNMDRMQGDISDLHYETYQNINTEQTSELSDITTASISVIKSNLTPLDDNEYDLGSSGNEWKDLYVDGTANVDAINLNGTAITATGAELNKMDGVTVTTANINSVTDRLLLTGGTMTGLIRGVVTSVKETPKNNTLDVQKTNVVEVNSAKAVTLTTLTAAFPGQELTILNIGSASTTLTRSTNSKKNGVYGGKNITIATGESYKLVCSSGTLWYVIS
tara:strand:+ start:1487 stop:2332 length:846 start_codon:yes stop_codon:yes gene_type:complete